MLGGIFNRGDLEGFYDWRSCKECLDGYFTTHRDRERVFGVVPEQPQLDGLREHAGRMTRDEVFQNSY